MMHCICVSDTNSANTNKVLSETLALALHTNLHVAVELFTKPEPMSVISVPPLEGPQAGATVSVTVRAMWSPTVTTGCKVINSNLPMLVAIASSVGPNLPADEFWNANSKFDAVKSELGP